METAVFNYSIDTEGTLTIFSDMYSIADISDCGKMTDEEIDELIKETLFNLEYIAEGEEIETNCTRNDYEEE